MRQTLRVSQSIFRNCGALRLARTVCHTVQYNTSPTFLRADSQRVAADLTIARRIEMSLANDSLALTESASLVLADFKMSRLSLLPWERPGDPPSKSQTLSQFNFCEIALANDQPRSLGFSSNRPMRRVRRDFRGRLNERPWKRGWQMTRKLAPNLQVQF